MNNKVFDKNSERSLRDTISRLRRDDAVLSYYQLQGFLFGVACSPELIKPSEWFDLIWLNDEPQFDGKEEAAEFYQLVVALARHIASLAEKQHYLPFSVSYSDSWQNELAQWCEGMLMGHMYLEDVWDLAIDDLNEPMLTEDVDIALSLASTFADLDSAQQLSFDEDMELTDEHLPHAYDLFWKSLGAYASVSDLWDQSTEELDVEQLFLALEGVSPTELCPCGSNLIFAKCCLH